MMQTQNHAPRKSLAGRIAQNRRSVVGQDEPILVTGAAGFIGSRVVRALLTYGFRSIRCFVRPASSREELRRTISEFPEARVEVIEGNLLSGQDCRVATEDVRVIYHLAAGSEKSFAGCVLNCVVTTRNLLDSIGRGGVLRRFVNVSSFAVYSNDAIRRHGLLDETCELEREHVWRHEPYAYAKLKQDEMVIEYAAKNKIPYVIVRPGVVYGRGKPQLTGRVGLETFGVFLHLGGRNRIPFTHVENCAAAIVLAGIIEGVDGQVFNVVDDELPLGREFLKAYRSHVAPIKYISVPYRFFYLFCWLWERYSHWSGGQLPPVFNRRKCAAYWKGNRYSNAKLKELLGWTPAISFRDGAGPYFEYLRSVRAC